MRLRTTLCQTGTVCDVLQVEVRVQFPFDSPLQQRNEFTAISSKLVLIWRLWLSLPSLNSDVKGSSFRPTCRPFSLNQKVPVLSQTGGIIGLLVKPGQYCCWEKTERREEHETSETETNREGHPLINDNSQRSMNVFRWEISMRATKCTH